MALTKRMLGNKVDRRKGKPGSKIHAKGKYSKCRGY